HVAVEAKQAVLVDRSDRKEGLPSPIASSDRLALTRFHHVPAMGRPFGGTQIDQAGCRQDGIRDFSLPRIADLDLLRCGRIPDHDAKGTCNDRPARFLHWGHSDWGATVPSAKYHPNRC